jgi:putative tryptophan/tyrosine transport system substrate-binding protein
MRRREFIALFGGAMTLSISLLAAQAQQAGKVWRVGLILGTSPPTSFGTGFLGGFANGMRDLGYVEGKDFVIEWRTAEGNYARFPEIATELVRLKVDIFVLGTSAALPAVQQATGTIPIVMAGGLTDPVGVGSVTSLARPGGNVTGLATSMEDTSQKQLELLATAVPNVSRFGLLTNPGTVSSAPVLNSVRFAAGKSGFVIVPVEAKNLEELEAAFATLTRERVGAVLVAGDSFFFVQRQRIAELALRNQMASMFPFREFAEAGGLMSYGESLQEFFQRSASFVDKIFKGANADNLPVEQPTRFHLIVNRKTADALGVTIPPVLNIFADEVIE